MRAASLAVIWCDSSAAVIARSALSLRIEWKLRSVPNGAVDMKITFRLKVKKGFARAF